MEREQPKASVKQLVSILNTDIPGHFHTEYALTKIKGVGANFAHAFCARYNIDATKLISALAEPDIRDIEAKLKSLKNIDSWMLNRQHDYDTGEDLHLLTTDLRFKNDFDVKRLQKIRAYKGMRHSAGLPVRGQRTKAHFRKVGRAVGVSRQKAKVGKK